MNILEALFLAFRAGDIPGYSPIQYETEKMSQMRAAFVEAAGLNIKLDNQLCDYEGESEYQAGKAGFIMGLKIGLTLSEELKAVFREDVPPEN